MTDGTATPRPGATITALRHAAPVQLGLCAGRFELPVAEVGDLEALARDLHERALRRIVSSTSLRCSRLARLLAGRLGLPLCLETRLRELDFGEWEGRSWDEIARSDPARFEAWSGNWQRAAPPGGESVGELVRRVAEFVVELPDECVLVVTHAGPIRAMRVLLGPTSWQEAMARPVPYCVPLVISG